MKGDVRNGIPAPGFSDRANDPEILAGLKKNRKAAVGCGFILVPLPLIGFILYSVFSDKMEIRKAVMFGGIVSAVFLVFALIGAVKNRAAKEYDATVIDKHSEWVDRRNGGSDKSYTRYTTVVRTTDGKKKNIVENSGSPLQAYEYLNVGDSFRYHPRFAFPYELYDKSRAPYLGCAVCGTKNAVSDDRCGKCKAPLLK